MSERRSPVLGYILQQIQTLTSAEIISIIYECAAELCMRRDVRHQQRQDALERSNREGRHRYLHAVGGVSLESDSEDSLWVAMDDSSSFKGFRKRWADRAGSEFSVMDASDTPGIQPSSASGVSDLPSLALGVPEPCEYTPSMSVPLDGGDQAGNWDLVSEMEQSVGDLEDPHFNGDLLSATSITSSSLEVVSSSGHEADWKRTAVESNVKRLKTEEAKFPWESGPFVGVFGSANHLWGTCLANQSRALTPTGIGLHDVLQSTAISSRASVSSVTAVVEQVQRLAASGARRERPDEDIRRMALDKLHDIILSDLSSTQLGVSLADIVQSGGDSDEVTQSLRDCFRMKSSGTLQKRASSLMRLKRILLALGVMRHPLRITEADLYAVLCNLRESGAGATSGQHLLEALFFLDGTVKLLACNVHQVVSGRCRGVARDLHLTKAPLNQKAAFRVNHIRFLEQRIHDLSSVEQCMVGQVLFCVHSCSRWRDSQRLQSLAIESGREEILYFGQTLTSKTTLSAEARTRFLPYAGIGTGLCQSDWVTVWMDARHEQGLEFGAFALPSFSERTGGWTDSPMSSSEITYIIRELLQDAADGLDLKQIGSHSAKVTLLTWAGRSSEVQFSHPERRLLGHHLDPGARSMMIYSREAYTSLYGKVLAMIKTIRTGSFDPDLPAVARIEKCSVEANVVEQTQPDFQQPEPTAPESDSSVPSEFGIDDLEVAEETDSSPTGFEHFPGIPGDAMMVHRVSGVVHVIHEDDFGACGRRMSMNFVGLNQYLGDLKRLDPCAQCLRAFNRKAWT